MLIIGFCLLLFCFLFFVLFVVVFCTYRKFKILFIFQGFQAVHEFFRRLPALGGVSGRTGLTAVVLSHPLLAHGSATDNIS